VQVLAPGPWKASRAQRQASDFSRDDDESPGGLACRAASDRGIQRQPMISCLTMEARSSPTPRMPRSVPSVKSCPGASARTPTRCLEPRHLVRELLRLPQESGLQIPGNSRPQRLRPFDRLSQSASHVSPGPCSMTAGRERTSTMTRTAQIPARPGRLRLVHLRRGREPGV